MKQARDQQQAFDQYVRDAAGGSAAEIAQAAQLLDAGTITQAEFDAIKAKVLAQEPAGPREPARGNLNELSRHEPGARLHPSVEERAARGRRRAQTRRAPVMATGSRLASAGRRRPCCWSRPRIAWRTWPIRHGRMLASPFAFRGAAALMAADLAETPQSGLPVQLCGDAHVSNFAVSLARPRVGVRYQRLR